MTAPSVFQPGDPEVSRNPIFSTQQNQATGMANIPGRFAGSADALSQLVQLQQSQKDQALGQLARVHAAIDAGIYPQEVMNTPEVQALFPKAGLDALAHQQLLPKTSDQVTQQRSAELASPIFSGPDAVGGAGSRDISQLPDQSKINVQNQQGQDTGDPSVARLVGGQPNPTTAGIKDSTAPIVASNEKQDAKIATDQLDLKARAVQDGEVRYAKDKYFASFVQELHAGVEKPYIEALKQQIANSGLEKQAQGNAATILGQAITSAPVDFQNEHKDWLDKQTQEANTFRQSLQLSRLSDEEQDQKVADHMMKWNFDHKEPTLEGIVSRNWMVNSKALGMTPEQATNLLKQTIHIETPGQQRLHTAPNTSPIIGSIIEQAKHDPKHITIDFGDGKGPVTGTLTHLYAPDSPLTKAQIDFVRQSLAGKNPKFNPSSGAGQGGANKRPANPLPLTP